MKHVRFGIALVFGLFGIANAGGPESSAAMQTVTVHTVEPTAATNQTQSLLGKCYGREVTIKFHHASSANDSTIIVQVGRDSRKYHSSEPFVRDLSYGSKAAYQFWIVCDNDSEKQVMLTAWGMSPGSDSAHPAYRRAQVTFSREAGLVSYSGVIGENFEVLNAHLE